MANLLLNDPGCGGIYAANTGTPGCAFNPGLIVGAMLVDKDKTFTITTAAAFITEVQLLCLAGPSTRSYPIYKFSAVEDKSTEPSFKELGYGSRQPTSDGKYDFVFEMTQGGHCHNNQLMHFNNDHSKRVIFFDENNMVIGTKTGATTVKGLEMEFFKAHPFKIATGKDAPSQFKVEFALSKPAELNEDIAYFDLGASPESSFQGLLDIEMFDLGAGSAVTKHVIGIRSICDKVNLYDAYSTTLVSAFATIFTAAIAGVNDVITAATAVPALKGIELDFTTGGTVVVTMAIPLTLAQTPNFIGGVGDVGFECLNTITLTVAT